MNLGELLETWAAKYDVTTVIERAVGVSAIAECGALARAGRRVIALVDDADVAHRMRASYGSDVDVRVGARLDAPAGDGEVAKVDMVVVHGSAHGAAGEPGETAHDWRRELTELGKHAAKLMVVIAPNPGGLESRARSLVARLRGHANGASGWGETRAVAQVLWEMGRVREHAWLDAPELAAHLTRGLAPRFTRSLSPLHAFVVDMTPRSPQARRKLRLSTQA